MTRHWIFRGLATAVACSTTVLNSIALNTHATTTPKKVAPTPLRATTQTLGGRDRFLTMISTDKPIYHGGEKVYLRGVLLNSANHKPMTANQYINPTLEIKGPKGDIIATGNAMQQDSVWGCAWEIPAGQAGGQYTVHVTYPWEGYAPAERKFEVRAYRAPRLKSQITFLRDGYGPGDKVNATLDVKRAEGGVPEGAKVTVNARVDGMEIKAGSGKVDSKGLCQVSFDLPHHIPRGEGTLALIIEDGGVVETASKTIPILLQTVDLQIFPEGGDLIAGFPNRVYVQAKQPNGKPADLVCKLICRQGSDEVTELRTIHEGRGRFEFTPAEGHNYYLSIVQPAGIKTTYPLPAARREGAVIHSDKDIFEKGQPVTVHVGGTTSGVRVTLSKYESELASCKLDLSKNSQFKRGTLQPVSFKVPDSADGVLTVTVWNEKGMPLAERLVFRQPANPLKISIKAEKKNYVPGDRTRLTIKTTDASGKPVSAVVGLTATDDSVLEMVEKREQAPRLPVMYYLEPEVNDLADAHVYLSATDPKAPVATDLLLATQGWRRFAMMDLAKFVEKYGDQGRRAVALKIQAETEVAAANGFMALRAMGPRGGMGGGMFVDHAGGPMPAGLAFALPPPKAAPPMPMDMFKAKEKAPAAPPLIVCLPAEPMAAPVPAPQPVQNQAMADQIAAVPVVPAQGVEQPVAGKPMPASFALQKALRGQLVSTKKRALLRDEEIAEIQGNLMTLRQFAHQVRKKRKPTDRTDFAETLYWNAGIKTDAKTGEAKVAFGLNDSVSTFRVFADGFAGDGAIGATDIGVESVQPFYAEAKLPLEVTSGDKILLPISLINATTGKLAMASTKVDLKGDFKLKEIVRGGTDIGAGGRVRILQPINVGLASGANDFVLTASAGAYGDKISRKLMVKPKGFPIEASFGGMLEPGKSVTHTVVIPANVVAGSISSNTAVYPTPLGNLTEALQRLIQDPCGCFEQTSSTSYPLTMAQQYFLSHTGVAPKLVEESRKKLDDGYKKLVGFWCPDKGYEWFGENPGHEALTAFGLLHFADMAKVRDVDQNMVAATRSWLLKQKDGHGGFTRKRRSLHTWIEDKDCSNAYIVWALLETGVPANQLTAEIDSLKTVAANSSNSYVVALAANALYLAGQKAEAVKLMDRLAAKQNADGSVAGIKSSIVGSEGESLQVEGTALATLAWMREPAYFGRVEKSIKFLADSCKAGRYGSTQATVLALRAIVTRDQMQARPKAPGKVRVYVDGQSIGDWIAFNQSSEGAIKLPDLSELLPPGEHKLELRMDGGSTMPYSMAVKYNALTPVSDKDCKLDLSVKMAQDKLVEGTSTEANVTVTNKTKDAIPTPVAIIGLPGGLEPRHDQLKELVKKGKIDAYEVLGREVVLYWRDLPGNARVEVPLSLIAAVPGTYTGPASRAYLYYTDEHKRWIDGVQVEIAAK